MFTFIGVVSLALPAAAGVPQLMNYQGRLSNDAGTPLDTTVSMEFAIYDDSTGMVSHWSETHENVYVANGLFSVVLGTIVPIDDSVFADTNRWLGVTVGGDTEIDPRTKLVTVPYAYRVSTIDGCVGGTLTGDFIMEGDTGDVASANKHPGLPKVLVGTGFTIYGAGRPSSVHLDDGANGIAIDLDGLTKSVGIGTSTMSANLDVQGNIYTLGGNGDVNGDGTLAVLDMTLVLNYLAELTFLTDAEYARADVDGDGRVNWDDLGMMTMMIFTGSTKSQAMRRIHSIYGAVASGPEEALYVKTRLGINTDSPQEKVHVVWDTNVDAEMGRGTTDPDITYLGLRNANGTKCYIYPNAAGNGIVVSTVKP
jgi:hypothetical protein